MKTSDDKYKFFCPWCGHRIVLPDDYEDKAVDWEHEESLPYTYECPWCSAAIRIQFRGIYTVFTVSVG